MPCAEARTLLEQAAVAVTKELRQLPEEFDIDSGSKGYVTARHRDRSLFELLRLSQHFGFAPETFANALLLTDRFLGLVKVYPKYMQCVALAGLLISAKLNEEEEFVPTVSDFIRVSRCGCSAGDLKRMEKLMANKLDWDLLSVTPVFFLHEFLKLFVTVGLIRRSEVAYALERLTPQLLAMLCKKSISRHKGSLIVLCLLWYDIEQTDSTDTSRIVDLARFLGVSDHEFVHCLGIVTDFMELSSGSPPVMSRKRKRSAVFSTNVLPTIVEASASAETEVTEKPIDVEFSDALSHVDAPNAPTVQSLEASDKQLHIQQEATALLQKPLYSTVVKSSCGTSLHKELVIYKDHTLVY